MMEFMMEHFYIKENLLEETYIVLFEEYRLM